MHRGHAGSLGRVAHLDDPEIARLRASVEHRFSTQKDPYNGTDACRAGEGVIKLGMVMFATSRGELWYRRSRRLVAGVLFASANPDLTAVLSIELRLLVVK